MTSANTSRTNVLHMLGDGRDRIATPGSKRPTNAQDDTPDHSQSADTPCARTMTASSLDDTPHAGDSAGTACDNSTNGPNADADDQSDIDEYTVRDDHLTIGTAHIVRGVYLEQGREQNECKFIKVNHKSYWLKTLLKWRDNRKSRVISTLNKLDTMHRLRTIIEHSRGKRTKRLRSSTVEGNAQNPAMQIIVDGVAMKVGCTQRSIYIEYKKDYLLQCIVFDVHVHLNCVCGKIILLCSVFLLCITY